MVTRSSHSINMCPPHSPTRITKKSILKLPGAFHWPNTSRIRFWAFSYSIGEPCGRSNQLITYLILSSSIQMLRLMTTVQVYLIGHRGIGQRALRWKNWLSAADRERHAIGNPVYAMQA